jgi:hypothetical protein
MRSVAMTFATSQCSAAGILCGATFAVCGNSRVRRHCFLLVRRLHFRQSALNLAVNVGHHRGIFVRRRRGPIGDAGAGRAGGAAAGAPARRPPAGPPRLHEGCNPPHELEAEFVDVGGHRIVVIVVAAVARERRLWFFALCGHVASPCSIRFGIQRGAGAIAGVVLEAHLAAVCGRRAIAIRKKDPTISDLNDALKTAATIETPTWRFIQHLGDLRNKCDHKKQSDPSKDDVIELIDGVRKITKTVF